MGERKSELAKMKKTFVALLLFFVFFAPLQTSAQEVPHEGLQAEMRGEWREAIGIYREAIRLEPDRSDLWIRIAEIEAHLGNSSEAAAALEEAAKLRPDDPDIFYDLSAAYSVANQPEEAFKAIGRAVELDPDNIEYLQDYAQVANWVDKPDVAAQTYQKIIELLPEDDSVLLGYAQSHAWSGRLDRSAAAYKKYLERNPDAPEVYIEYAQVETWRGNYPEALNILERYHARYGESEEYLLQKATVLGWARRPTPALEILSSLLESNPGHYYMNYARTIALHHDNRPIEAIESLEKVTELNPDSEETDDLRRFILTPLRSNIAFGAHFYSDSDDLDRWTNTVVGTYWLDPLTSFQGGASVTYLHADEGSGLEELDGGEDNRHTSGWLGAFRRLNPNLSFDGYAGAAEAESDSHFIYGLGLDYQPLDTLALRVERAYGYYVVSPRTIDLGIRQGANRAEAVWEPNLLYTVVGTLAYSDFSDDNEMWEAVFAPRRAFLRTEKFNLDLGVRGQWFGFDDQLDNGYYDPEFYQSYGVTGFGYWKLSDDDGVSLALDLGVLKDDDMDDFRSGLSGALEGTFGLYRDIMLVVGLSGTNNNRQSGGAFKAFVVYATLTYRF
jgi:tetratricopeptide (TPR) repeat protein